MKRFYTNRSKELLRSVLFFSFISLAVESFSLNYSSRVSFLHNEGQWKSDIVYQGIALSTNVYLLNNGLSFSQKSDEENDSGAASLIVWNMKFAGLNHAVTITGENEKQSVYSYLSGNDPSKWVIHPMECSIVSYNDLYKNIDLKFYTNENHLEYDYILHPGSNIQSIQTYYEGIKNLMINKSGDLEISTPWTIQIQKAPISWQIIDGKKHDVKVEFVLINDSTFGFTTKDKYDKSSDLIIDPLFQMVWSSYTRATGGGNNINYCFGNAMDNDGNVYLTGMVDGSFPTTAGAYSGPGNIYPEIFVAKFSADGSTMIYGTYLPGSSSEFGTSLAVDDLGRAYVTGVVDLNITGLTNFPSTANAYQPVHNAGSDAFITVLNSTGTGLVYSSFLGGTGSETGYGIALGSSGIAFITGSTSIGNFPVKASSAFPTGDRDAFIAKFDINQSGLNSLVYSARIGGGPFSYVDSRSIAVNSAGNVFITGKIYNSSGTPTYPITSGAYTNVYSTGMDGVMTFVTKLDPTTPVTLSYSTYLVPGTGNGIAVDPVTDDAFIVGSTFTFAFPVTTGALQPMHAGTGNTDGFAVRLNAAGSALVYSTFLGGYMSDWATSVATNSAGEAYVVGISQDSFPTSAGSVQPNNAGHYDFFAVNLNASGTGYACGGSTYIGGSSADYSGSFYDYPSPHVSIREHGGNNDTICISSTTHSQDFPTTAGAYEPNKVNGIADQPVFFKLTCNTPGIIPVVTISALDSTWCNKQATSFYDNSTNNPTSWTWYFPGAFPSTSTLQNPTGIYYPTAGSFDVTLVACNAFGCDSITYPNFITEYDVPAIPFIQVTGDTLCVDAHFGYEWFESSDLTNVLSTNQCFVPSVKGNYSVLVYDTNGCSTLSPGVITDIDHLSGNQDMAFAVPNPFHHTTTIHFKMDQVDVAEIEIVDPLGRVILTEKQILFDSSSRSFAFDLTGFNSGVYFCKILVNNKSLSLKVIKE